MSLQIIDTSINHNYQYDITDQCYNITWKTSIMSQPSSLSFSMVRDPHVYLETGDIIELKIDGKGVFKGKIFVRSKDKEYHWSVTAYDGTRYLKNEDTLLFNASTASQRFETICQTQGLPFKVLDRSSYNCTPVIEDAHTYYSMLDDAITETRQHGGGRFAYWDNYGTMEFFRLDRQVKGIVIGDESLMTNYRFQSSIENHANAVKVLRENKDKGQREIYQVSDDKNIRRYGKLQAVKKISDAELNASQLQDQAKALLKEKNYLEKTLTVNAVGETSLRAGNSFLLMIYDLWGEALHSNSLSLIKSCTHDLSKGTMTLEVEVSEWVANGWQK
ncbi:MAG: hypothetical protein Q4A55_06610 [Aerococcus sp.]|nr:hypothetical protein [Aerococcus sp.]